MDFFVLYLSRWEQFVIRDQPGCKQRLSHTQIPTFLLLNNEDREKPIICQQAGINPSNSITCFYSKWKQILQSACFYRCWQCSLQPASLQYILSLAMSLHRFRTYLHTVPKVVYFEWSSNVGLVTNHLYEDIANLNWIPPLFPPTVLAWQPQGTNHRLIIAFVCITKMCGDIRG